MPRLYKYYPPTEYSFKSLSARGLWCHHAANMNDPFDCLGLVARNFSKEKLDEFRSIISQKGSEKHKKWLKLNDSQLTQMINDHRSKSIKKYAFCALSERQDLILMWSHYAKAHTGFVIELDFPELKGDHHMQKVNYLRSIPEFDLVRFADFMTGDDSQMNYMFQDLSIKSVDWAYELEWRIWRRNPSYYYYKPDQVKGIYFGINADFDTKRTVVELTDYLPDDFTLYAMEFNKNPVKLKY